MAFQAGVKTESGYLAIPASGSGPGVLVIHAWWGLNEFFTSLCDRLALAGFVALAPDLFGGAIATTIAEAETLRDAHDRDFLVAQAHVLESLTTLLAYPALQGKTVGTLGCSLGSWWALQMASQRPDDVSACMLFYGVGEADYTTSRAAYLGHFAENDAWEPLEQVHTMEAEIRAAGREVTFHLYAGVGHWFFEDNQPSAYHAASAQLAFDRTVSFLRERLAADPAL